VVICGVTSQTASNHRALADDQPAGRGTPGNAMTATPVAASTSSNALPLTATVGALGVVYGDIGTSPLYALKEAAKAAAHGGPLARKRSSAWPR